MTRPDPAITTTDLPVLPARSSIVQSVLDQLQPVTLDGTVKTNDILDNNDDVMLNEPPLDWIHHWCNGIQSESMSLLDEEHLSASNTAVNDTDIPMTMDTHLESVKEESTNPRTLVVDDYKHPVNITVQPAVDKLSEFLKRLFASQDALEQQQQQQQNTTAYVVSSIDNTLFTRDGPSNDEQKSQQWILSASSVQQLYYMCHHSHLSMADVNDVTSAITSYTQLFLQYPIISDLSRLEHLLEQVIQQGETCALMLLESTANDSALNRAWSLNQLNTGIQAVLCVLAIMTQSGSLHPRVSRHIHTYTYLY
ncbi:hypothetical protein BDF22DRAFT_2683 [Syncephalis plumigaleata]|nr:hypothetical protein BDF22DRAFT_2683 [Syncephalis plumigaleata]